MFTKLFGKLLIVTLFSGYSLCAQKQTDHEVDSLARHLEEVIIITNKSAAQKYEKPLGSIESYLEKSECVNMVRRGAYAWEPYVNGMASERSITTIGGMRIYAACTDKMDPVTSYVEVSNLSKAAIHNGPSGSATGSTIAGSIDLQPTKAGFGERQMKGRGLLGFESNNAQKILGGGISFSHPKWYVDVNTTFRNASNYHAGGGQEILYSQFTKWNFAANAGYKLSEHKEIEASLIYDKATNVGYPALPMDVALAKAFIGSISYSQHHISPIIHLWETKFYHNDITHKMDDSKRPFVAIRMDMPGKSRTTGFYSKLVGESGINHWIATLSGHQNQSRADMTMFANAPGQKDMYMLTWPNVFTNYLDAFLTDDRALSEKFSLNFSAGIAAHNNVVKDTFGLESLQIFYPDMERSRTRILTRASIATQYVQKSWVYKLSVSFGTRAPSVSEGYGFYLFNSFDGYDYIGNPMMHNEKSTALSTGLSYSNGMLMTKINGSIFYISDYIVGIPNPQLSGMTIGGNGVKVYQQVSWARIANVVADVNLRLSDHWQWNNNFGYRRGVAALIGNIPFIQPFSYSSDIGYKYKSLGVNFSMFGNARHNLINPQFGEHNLPPFVIFNLSASKQFQIRKLPLIAKAGVENLADSYYATFSDWNAIPRMGRNFYINLIVSF
ncbi:MAG: TonB-dependent receptor [Bacteroidetes bacterium]|nr:TonB-dependent receptor [Bacteroidota bacterium]